MDLHSGDPLHAVLEPDEAIELIAKARDHRVVVTDRRLAVADERQVALQVSYPKLRRIEFDIERDRPATLVIVPDLATDEPQVLSVPVEDYESIARALVEIGRRIAS